MKIFIGGACGSGKSTYSKKLAEELSLPAFDLDNLNWENHGSNSYSTKRSKEEREALIKDLLQNNEHWIVEGAYHNDWIQPFIDNADEFRIMNASLWTLAFRITKRSLRRLLKLEESKYRETFGSFCKLMFWNWEYDKKYLPKLKARIERTGKKFSLVK